MDLEAYQQQFIALHLNFCGDPAKRLMVSMMLSVMDHIEQGFITQNRIVPNDLLTQTFSKYLREFQLERDESNLYQAFLHLESTSFWHHREKTTVPTKRPQHIGVPEEAVVAHNMVDYACLDDDLFYYLTSDITRPELRAALLGKPVDLGEKFKHWAVALGKTEKTVKNYLGALQGSMSNWVNEAGITEKHLTEISSLGKYRQIVDQLKTLAIFETRNSVGKGMYSAALKLYEDFLSDTTGQSLTDDIEKIQQDLQLTNTEKAILTSTRIGQGQYRQKLIEYWQGCAVTGFSNPSLLVASHIKPWKASNNKERLDPYNGLLLLPNLDKAFDLGYISFKKTGEVLLSKSLDNYTALGISNGILIRLENRHQEYLEFHRDLVFKK